MATVNRPRATNSKTAKGAAPSEMAKIATQAMNLQDEIRIRAFHLFVQRGCKHGRDLEDWVRAESEVLARFGAHTA